MADELLPSRAEQVQAALELQTPEAAAINPATTAVPEQERR